MTAPEVFLLLGTKVAHHLATNKKEARTITTQILEASIWDMVGWCCFWWRQSRHHCTVVMDLFTNICKAMSAHPAWGQAHVVAVTMVWLYPLVKSSKGVAVVPVNGQIWSS